MSSISRHFAAFAIFLCLSLCLFPQQDPDGISGKWKACGKQAVTSKKIRFSRSAPNCSTVQAGKTEWSFSNKQAQSPVASCIITIITEHKTAQGQSVNTNMTLYTWSLEGKTMTIKDGGAGKAWRFKIKACSGDQLVLRRRLF